MLAKIFTAILAGAAAAASGAEAASSIVNTTSSSFNVIVKSNDSITNGRAVSLRINQYFTASFYMAIDVTSYTLLGILNNGVLHNGTRGANGKVTPSSTSGYISESETDGSSTYYIPGFATAANEPVDSQWYLAASDKRGVYNLKRNVMAGLQQDWLLCLSQSDLAYGPWYSLNFVTYKKSLKIPSDLTSCETVELEVNLTSGA